MTRRDVVVCAWITLAIMLAVPFLFAACGTDLGGTP